MCGIVGCFQKTDLTEALKSIHHRGPDFSDSWTDEQVTLGHARLSILDLSEHGRQPMHSASGRYIIVFNGEIYNFKQLKLLCDTANWRGGSDTEVILALIEKFGIEATLPKLAGMFALAIWDRHEQCLTLARDRLGEKPLYYGVVNQQFVFASELKAIRALLGPALDLNSDAVSMMLTFSYVPAPMSIYQSIEKLLPSHYLRVKKQGGEIVTELRSYWSIQNLIQQPRQPMSLTGQIQKLDGLLTEVLQQEMVSDVPLGAFLSGGIDSSLIVAKMQALSDRPIKTFTIGFNEKNYNESEQAKKVAQYLQTEHHELMLNASDLMTVIPQLPMIYDEPFADSSQLPTYFVAKMTKAHVTVALSGDGGDELFGGYNRYIWAQKIWKLLRWVPMPIRQLIFQAQHLPGIQKLGTLQDKLQKIERISGSRNREELYFNLIKTKVDAKLDGYRLQSTDQFQHYLDYMCCHDLKHYLPDDILVKVDRASMSHSLETRAPFLHPSIVEFAMQCPPELKVRGKAGKLLLRGLLNQYIPESLWNRPKMGFAIPLRDWLRGPLRDWAESLLSVEKLRSHDLLPTQELRQKWMDFQSKTTSYQYEIWNALMFQAWYEQWKRA